MNSSVWLIAWRYLLGTQQEKSISIMVKVCFLGIFIGSCSLALVMAIMNGFERVTHEKMQGIHAQLIIKSRADALNTAAIGHVINTEFPDIISYSPQQIGQVIVTTDDTADLTNVVMIKGIDPKLEATTSTLETKIVTPTSGHTLPSIVHERTILIGSACAESLHVSAGDHINLVYVKPEDQQSHQINLDTVTAVVGGTFKTGIEEFDTSLIFCSQQFFDQLFPDQGVSTIALKLRPGADEQTLTNRLKQRLKLDIYSWKDLYPALVSALKLEKYVMFIILALIVLVASMNMISLLFMQIVQKRGDIAILKSMGMAHKDIRTIFLIMALSLAISSSLIGLTCAGIIGLFLQQYPIITLPDVYYVSNLPVHLDIRIFALIFVIILLMSIVATWLPIRSIKNIHVADVLRYDA